MIGRFIFKWTDCISDDAYDALLDKLRAADPAHPLVNGEVVGARPEYDDGGKKVELPFCMGSLDKVKSGASPEEAAEVDRKLARWTHEYPGPYTISDKLDGVSALVVFDGIEPIKVYTRGDGRVGQDISHIVEHLRRVPTLGKIQNETSHLRLGFRSEIPNFYPLTFATFHLSILSVWRL